MTEEPKQDLEKYLLEPTTLLEDLKPLAEKLAQYEQMMKVVEEGETSTFGLVKTIKDPKAHSAQGVLGLYNAWKGLSQMVQERVKAIGNGYEFSIGGKKVEISPENTSKIWNYRLDWANTSIGKLFFIYKPEINEMIAEQKEILDEMVRKYSG